MSAAIVLAAGRGTRFGGGKMLAQIDGRPMLQHVLDLCAEAKLQPVVVVLGDDSTTIESQIKWREEHRVLNPQPDQGLASSLVIGLNALDAARPRATRVLVLLGDQPALTTAQLQPILATSPDPDGPIVVPRYADGQSGNPVLLERDAWPLALELVGDRGMSQLFAKRPDLVRHVGVPGTNPDIDTQSALAAFTRDGGPARSSRTVGGDRSKP